MASGEQSHERPHEFEDESAARDLFSVSLGQICLGIASPP